MLWPPGLQHSYSNVPPGLTAAVVERLTSQAFDDAARRLVFEPLDMAPASYQPVAGLPGGFRADGVTPIPYWHMTFPAFGALNASPAAMATLLRALLNHGRLGDRQAVAAPSVARMYQPAATAGARAGLEVGYGAGLYGWVSNGHLFHGHGGDADGYRARLGLLRNAGRGYLLGINVDDPVLLGRLQRRVEGALVADLRPPEPIARAIADTDLERYEGDYYPASARFGIDRWHAGEATPARLTVTQGILTFRRGTTVQPLEPLGDGRFRRPGDPAVSVVFVDWQGALLLQGELGNFARTSVAPCAGFVPVCRVGSARNTLANRPALWHGQQRSITNPGP
jgi:CubicO group peptidase (beta-lactamase class C family)